VSERGTEEGKGEEKEGGVVEGKGEREVGMGVEVMAGRGGWR